MSKLIKDATLRGIADAIRGKMETSGPIKVKDFASVIANMETGATEGMFCWAKNSVTKGEQELSFPTNSLISLTPSAGGYEIKSGSGSAGWSLYYLNSGLIDTNEHRVKIDYTIGAGLGHNILIGFADTTPVSTYSNLDYSFFSGTDKKINNWQNGSNKGTYDTLVTEDKVTVEVYRGKMNVYRNDNLVFTSSMTFTAGYACIVLYSANTTYGVINATMDNADVLGIVGYVVGNEEDAYPNDGLADDGYWYQKVGATKVTHRYATGTQLTQSGVLTVSGLSFKPVMLAVSVPNTTIAYAVCDPSGAIATTQSKNANNNIVTTTFTSSDDGFSFLVSSNLTQSYATWYAIGY